MEASETVATGIRRVLLERIDQIVTDLSEAPRGRDKGVHDARKSCKRIRAAYRLIRDEIGVDLYRQENIRFRDTARLLAGARDTWVMIRTLDKLIGAHADQVSSDIFRGFRGHLMEKYQTTLAGDLDNQATLPPILETMAEARNQIKNLPFVNQDFSAFEHGVRRVYTRGRRGLQLSYAQPSAEAFHEWRKRVKYLWHQLEILEIIWPKMLSQLANELHTLSDYLGDDHDLAVLRSTALETPASFDNRKEQLTLIRWIDAERLRLEALAYPLGTRLYFDPPKRFTQRLRTYWDAWEAEHDDRQGELVQNMLARSPAYFRQDEDLLTTTQMASRLEIWPDKVRQLIHDGKLPAEQVGAIWIIKADTASGCETRDDKLLSPREAADRLNLSLARIRKMIRSGDLPATQVGRYWVIYEADLTK